MGLDMYLRKKTYVKNWDFMKPEQKHEVTVKYGGVTHNKIKPERVSYIIEEVCYWRKANQVHKWFVAKVQNGADDCEEYYVPRRLLVELLEACQVALEQPEKAKEVLPTQVGFFFGSTEYDEYYQYDLEYTVEALTLLLKEDTEESSGSYYYQSSW